MLIKVLGCSTAFPGLKTYNQSFLIEENGKRLLVDCGEDTPKALLYHGIDVKSIDGVYISHLHSDHCFGIPRLGLSRYDFVNFPTHFSKGKYAPKLYGKELVLKNLWEAVKHPLATLQNVSGTLETFFEPIVVSDSFMWEGWKFRLIQQVHVVSDADIMPSFGLIITKEGHKSIYLTTDSQYCSPRQVEDFYKIVDIIVQDCELIGVNTLFEEGAQVYQEPRTPLKLWPLNIDDPDGRIRLELQAQGIIPFIWDRSKFFSGVHANYAQLASYPSANSPKLSREIKAKMWLSHYQDFKYENKDMYGNTIDWDAEAKMDGFAGFIQQGQVFEI
jgi:hypothetical protein